MKRTTLYKSSGYFIRFGGRMTSRIRRGASSPGLKQKRGLSAPRSRLAILAVVCAAVAPLPILAYAIERQFPAPYDRWSGAASGPQTGLPEPITPLLSVTGLDAGLVELGGLLFTDQDLSGGAGRSCATCHKLDGGGEDGKRRAIGIDGEELLFNVPSIFNAAKNYRFNWRGNFTTLEEQNEAILLDPNVMGATWPRILRTLGDNPDYVERFQQVLGERPTRRGVLDALGAFQRSLTTPDSRFDRYLRGDAAAITAEEEQGYVLFKAFGCVSCHQGENIGGNLMQRFPVFSPRFAQERQHESQASRRADLGRYTITERPEDRYLFRVPSLRNVALTAPYFHDGRSASLHDAVDEMAASQLGRRLPRASVDLIVKFLATLSGRTDMGVRPAAQDKRY
ncbi:MAG: cytochrome c peroxidase [Aurantimonas endophytica]|uniref:cytochrome-c peroxidase n=1 Tax=Aurantimonas endophytica TaxID=1522175 RepID=UPI003003808C